MREGERWEETERRTEQIWLLYPAVKRGQKTSKTHVAMVTVWCLLHSPTPPPLLTHIDTHVANGFIKNDGTRRVECALGADLLPNTLFLHLYAFLLLLWILLLSTSSRDHIDVRNDGYCRS